MRPDYAAQLKAMHPDDLERFVADWLSIRRKEYVEWDDWGGAGDRGRDVVGYVTKDRHEGTWDNFQCKRLKINLALGSALVELGKIFMHSAEGHYSLPRNYTFVAPRGVGRSLQELSTHPERFRRALLDQWDSQISNELVENKTIPLSDEIRSKVMEFDFRNIFCLTASKLVKEPSCMPVLVSWFGADPGKAPAGTVPIDFQTEESPYLGQLLKVYEERTGRTFESPAAALADADFGEHFRDQRVRFFDAVEFEKFYRDSTPDDYVPAFKDDIYHGVVDVHRDTEGDRLAKLNGVMRQAALLRPPGILGMHAGSKVKQGTCHRLANEGTLKWA
ncbi:ABC-three component system protein [Rhizobium sp. 11515TR]|uniref:ABC-three component system protein n=1 Tax=Rhizobium sp. 11515TR TaxID=2028343 RepID=UPI000BA8B202|nr:ABC-three component system protein [Rhizobium sp. 11515TR]ASW06415.1 hypothetical protein CKA34_11305 [Rhizobium sp. 11515TR]